MLAITTIILVIIYILGSISPLLVTEDTQDIVAVGQ